MDGRTATDEMATKLSSGCSTIGASPCTSPMPWMSQCALDLERLRDAIELGEIGIGGFAAHDVVDEGAIDAGDLADLRGVETELPAPGLEAVGNGVAHWHPRNCGPCGPTGIDSSCMID